MQEDEVKLSIITPSYNSMPFIIENIKSITQQSYKNFEHIIIDGGSIDGTTDHLKLHPFISWVSEKDNGQSDAINKGLRKSSGKLIGWLNSDDVYEPEIFTFVVEFFKNNPDISIIHSDINIIDESSMKPVLID
jgi:glycosyltransferase involved in cell wall biosynthesis